MVAGAIAGNISAEATTPTGNTFAEAMRARRSPGPKTMAGNGKVARNAYKGAIRAQLRALAHY